MDVGSFLHGLGLQQYEQAFRNNAINVEVLPDLTDADLAALGVLLGHRKKVLKAVAALCPPATGEPAVPWRGSTLVTIRLLARRAVSRLSHAERLGARVPSGV
jgi:SAM domain (Sterile alpha motif)